MRHPQDGRGATQLAVSSRPAHRCLWSDHQPVDRLMAIYRMPAEWEPHEGTWLAWPHEKTDWPGKFAPVPWVYCEIVRQLARVERVHILVNNNDTEQRARKMLQKAHADLDAVDFFPCLTDRSW